MLGFLLAAGFCWLTATTALADDTRDQTGKWPQANSFAYALFNGRTKALLRYSAQYRNSSLHVLQDGPGNTVPDQQIQQYFALGGYVGYETLPWNHLNFGATIYTAFPFGSNPASRRGLGGLYEGNGRQDPYAALGEAYAQFSKGGHLLKAGRQEMPDFRFVSLSDIRVSPYTHSGVVYENTVHDAFTLNLAYIARMKERNDWQFIDMARAARLQVSTNGKQLIRGPYNPDNFNENGYIGPNKEMAMVGGLYSKNYLALEAWNYYVDDFVNTQYLFGEYVFEPGKSRFIYTLAAQYTRQRNVGNHIAGNIDTRLWGIRVAANSGPLSGFISYNQVDYNEDSYDGGTIFVRWGTPQMFNSFQVQDSELAGTKSVGAGLQYDFGYNGVIPGLVMRWRYGDYNLPDKLYMTDARQDRAEATFDLRYSFTESSGFGIFTAMKGLSILFRLAYDNYRTDYDFEAYEKIHGYTFQSVTSDFYDVRLYLDYRF